MIVVVSEQTSHLRELQNGCWPSAPPYTPTSFTSTVVNEWNAYLWSRAIDPTLSSFNMLQLLCIEIEINHLVNIKIVINICEGLMLTGHRMLLSLCPFPFGHCSLMLSPRWAMRCRNCLLWRPKFFRSCTNINAILAREVLWPTHTVTHLT